MSLSSPLSKAQSFSTTQPPGKKPPESTARGHKLLILAALIVLALTLRSPITAVAPIINDLRQGLAIDSVVAGLLTSIPVLCFGVLTPFASAIIARTTIEAAIFITLGGTMAGLILRSAGGIGLSLTGTVVLGTALTIGNIVSLMVIARDFPRRTRLVTGLYTSALNVGTMLTSAVTAPLAILFGWRIALASCVALAIPALALWVMVLRRSPGNTRSPLAPKARERKTDEDSLSVWCQPLAWLLVAAFATHLMVYYSLTAWLPDYFMQTNGMAATAAGLIASVFQILALLGSFGVPMLAPWIAMPWLLVGIAACWIVTPLGFLLAPESYILWSVLGGIASGGGFTAIFVLIMGHARSLHENRRISAFVQGGGYTVSAAGPLLIGHLHQAFGSWTPSFLLLAGSGVVMLICGLGVTRLK